MAHAGGCAEGPPGNPALLFHSAQLPARGVDRAALGADPPGDPGDPGCGRNPIRGSHGDRSGVIDRHPTPGHRRARPAD